MADVTRLAPPLPGTAAWKRGSAVRYLGRLDSPRLVRVEATMQQGASLHPWWPLPLDALLADVMRRGRLGDRGKAGIVYPGGRRRQASTGEWHGQTSEGDHHHEHLPLTRIVRLGPLDEHPMPTVGKRWVWSATCAVPLGPSDEDVHWWHRRFDHARAEQVVGSKLPPLVRANNPRYAARMPLVTTVCRALEWWAVGDPEGIEQLLVGVHAVGKKHNSGEGAVVRWSVEDHGDAPRTGRPPHPQVVALPDGRPARPLPARAAAQLGAPGADTVLAPYRPPYWRPKVVTNPGGAVREWPQVVAPWVQLPAIMDGAT